MVSIVNPNRVTKMSIHDAVGDFITVIRNAGSVGKKSCAYPHSKLREGIARILKERGFVENFGEGTDDEGRKCVQLQLKYVDGNHAIKGISRASTPGLRSYCGYREIPRVLGGLGISILSTPKGLLDDSSARRQKVGGEILCNVW